MPEPLPDFEAIDLVDDVVVRRLLTLRDQVARPGEDVLGDLLSLFERDSAVRLLALQQAVADADGAARKSAAHALKGAAGNVGARRVAAIAAHVEKNDVDDATLAALAAAVEASLRALRARMTGD